MPRITLLVTTTLFFLSSVQGQHFFKKLTEENGLSDNRITCFLKDKTGFFWIGTKNGLNRYDGHSFKIFRPGPGNSISNEVINDIVQDSSGKIWIATMVGLNIYDPASNHWETIMPDSKDVIRGIPSSIVWDLEIKDNKIWIVCDNLDLSQYDPFTKKFVYYNWKSWRQQKLFLELPQYRSIHKIVRKNDEEWWLGTTMGLVSLNIRTGIFQFHGSGYNASVRDLKYDEATGNVFIMTDKGELFYNNDEKKKNARIEITSQPYPAVQWKKNRPLDKIILMPHTQGIVEVNPVTCTAILITHHPELSASLLPGSTFSIYTDNTGIVWIGAGNGINYYNSRNTIADFIPLMVASDKESTDKMTAALYDAAEGKYYVTSVQENALFIIDDHTGYISTIRSINGKSLTGCTNICTDRSNVPWLLTETNVYRYDRIKKQFMLFPTPNKNDTVYFHDFIEDKEGNYWFATWEDGVYRYKTKEKTFHQFTYNDSISAHHITSLLNDPVDDAIWIGSFSTGIYRFDLRTHTFINYSESDNNPDYLQLALVRDLEADPAGKLWVSTIGGGMYIYQRGQMYDKSFSNVTAKNGLSYGSYYSLAADSGNRLWLLSERGLSVVDKAGKLIYNANNHPLLNFANYAPDAIYPKRICWNQSKKELLVPVAGGLMLYYPDRKAPATDFPVVFTNVSVNGKPILYDASSTGKQTITVPWRSNSLSFDFATLNYERWGDIKYEYKLHGSDKEWQQAGTSHSLNFPDLSSGHYTFMIRARDPQGLVSDVASLSFIIKPPFWKTAWFIAAVVMILLSALYFWIRSLQRKLKAQKILNYFATSLYGQNTVEDIFWDVAKNCMSQLKLEDCVIYIYQPGRKSLVQKAAYGPKNPDKHEIMNTLEIPYGKGIVGAVAATQKPVIIKDTREDERYIVDDQRRRSEIAVPVFVDGKIFGVIDSEHSRKNFYTRWHLRLLQQIASICSNKISKYLVAEKVRTDIARDLHDEMGSTLTSINIMSTLALQQTGAEAISTNLQKIKDYSGDMMESMSDIVWAINPQNDSIDRMILRMRELAEELLEPARINYSLREIGALSTLKLDVNQRKELYLIYKEAVNNAVKYSGATELLILLKEENGSLRLEVKDNGTGFDANKHYSGSGIQNMYSRAEKIRADLQINSAKGSGTSVAVSLVLQS